MDPASFNDKLRAGHALGAALIGMPGEVAAERAVEAGFHPELVGPEVQALTADYRADRLRLFLDEDGLVRDAQAG